MLPDTALTFIHLHVHSTYSLLEGALQTSEIADAALQDNQFSIALTDTNNLFGALEFTTACLAKGVQPIIGCQILIDFESNITKQNLDSIVLLACDEIGLANLMKLASMAYLGKDDTPPSYDACIKISWLKDYAQGLILLTGGPSGPIDKALAENNIAKARSQLKQLKQIFSDRIYIELQRFQGYSRAIEHLILEMSIEEDIELVATNEAFFLNKAGFEAHDALLAISHSNLVANKNRYRVSNDHYIKSQKEMAELFIDLPCAISNSVKIAIKCGVFVKKRNPILPKFIENEGEAIASLRNQTLEGLDNRLIQNGMADGFAKEDYIKRLNYELDIIINMQFQGYFLIVADFIKWAKNAAIPVGPGRGSGAGSLVAYALTITDVDPLKFSLLFERFLNPDRVSMPDFDIDFCQDRRGEVIKYVQNKYGKDRVAHIITFGKMQARAVLRDVGRVLQIPYSKVDYLCKLVRQGPGAPINLAQAIREESKFKEAALEDSNIDRLLEIALQLEGLFRHASTHAAGIVIGDRPLDELVPMYFDAKSSMPVTQYNMKYVEQAGLVKFDFLGLKTLSVLNNAVNLARRKNINLNLLKIDLKDAATYDLLASGETIGVFQVESPGMRQALIGMQPDCIEDIIALVALYRPGPMENIPVYNRRKNGLETVAYIHPDIEDVLKETQGVIVYQEQVMQIAQRLAGYSLGEADLLRRAMGKKIHSEMEQQRARFISGAEANNIAKSKANEIFDLLAKFADYGFNKSHAAAYGLISFQTAYMKANFPVEFLAASMNYDMLNTEKLNIFRIEALRLGIEIVAPTIQSCGKEFEVAENKIFYSLAAIKGVGENVAAHIAHIRNGKSFESLEHFCQSIDPKEINKLAFEGLINAGAFDSFGVERAILFASVSRMLTYSARAKHNKNSMQQNIFGAIEDTVLEKIDLISAKGWTMDEKLHREILSLGFYVTGHPLTRYGAQINNYKTYPENITKFKERFTTPATLIAKQLRKTKKGERMLILTFSQPNNIQFEVPAFENKIQQFIDKIIIGASLLLYLEVKYFDDKERVNITDIKLLQEESPLYFKQLSIAVNNVKHIDSLYLALSQSSIKTCEDKTLTCEIKLLCKEASQSLELRLEPHYIIDQSIYNKIRAIEGLRILESSKF